MIVKTEQQYQECLEVLKDVEVVALDVETEAFSDTQTHPLDLGLYGVGLYSNNMGVYIPERFLDRVSFQKFLDSKESVVMHNAKFDLTILQKEGINIDTIQYEDTMIMSWLLNENRMTHGLKKLAQSVLGVKEENVTTYKEMTNKPQPEDFGLFADDEFYHQSVEEWENKMGQYCIDDCKYTKKIFDKFLKKITDQELLRVYRKLELPFIRVLMDMENRGIMLDEEYLKGIGVELDKEIIETQALIWKEAGKQFDINSPKQLSEVLYTDRGYTVSAEHQTKTGANSTNIAALKYLKEAHPKDKLIGGLIKYREIFKLKGTYIEGLRKKLRAGAIHTSFKQHGTKTGRLSSNNPNLQQLPRRDDKYDIRKAFIPRDGYTFVISDLSQVELRLAAHFSQDPILLKAFQEGKDVHQETADILGCSRTAAKCFSEGTVLASKNGNIKVENLIPEINSGKHTKVEHNFSLEDGKGNSNTISSTYYESGVKDWIEFELDNGDKVEVTPDHRMIVLREGKELSISAENVLDTDEFIEIE